MKYTIAISGISAADNPGPGTGIARSLKESDLDVRIIGLAYDAMEPGIYMDWIIDKSYILPYPSGNMELFLNRIKYIHEKENLDIIISALDVETPLLIKMEPEITSMGIKMMIPTYESYHARDKIKLPSLADQFGLKTPEIIPMNRSTDIEKAIKKLGFPMMIKGPFYEACKVWNNEQAETEFHSLSTKWGFPVIAQRFIKGDEYNCAGLGDGTGNDLGHFAIKKMVITKLGKVWTNVSIINQQIFDAAEKMVKKLKWCGGYELELILETSTNTYYCIEINPRFPAWLYIATGCGINLPARMVKFLLGLPYETHSDYKAGKILIRYTGELIRDISDFEKLTVQAEL